MTKLVCSSCGTVYKTRRWKPEMDEARCECGGSRVSPAQARRSVGVGVGGQAENKRPGAASSTPQAGASNSPSVRTARPRKGLKRGRGFQASKAQREKVRDEPCVYCGQDGGDIGPSEFINIDPAHLWPRGKGGCDHPDCVIPLCRRHHRQFDEHQLELLPSLVRKGYFKEMGHAITVHEVSPGELITRCTAPSTSEQESNDELEAA